MKKVYDFADLLSKIFLIITVVLSFLVIYMLIIKIIGHSPTVTEITLGIITVLLGAFISSGFHIYSQLGKVSENLKNVNRTLNSNGRDFKNHMDKYHYKNRE
jgi:hypothetical protein